MSKRPTQRSRRPTQSFEKGQKTHLEVQEGSEGLPEGPGGVGRPIPRSEWDPTVDPGGIGCPTQRSRSGRKAHLEVRRVRRPIWWSRNGREAHLKVREGS